MQKRVALGVFQGEALLVIPEDASKHATRHGVGHHEDHRKGNPILVRDCKDVWPRLQEIVERRLPGKNFRVMEWCISVIVFRSEALGGIRVHQVERVIRERDVSREHAINIWLEQKIRSLRANILDKWLRIGKTASCHDSKNGVFSVLPVVK
ncbi:hypothetical protein ATCV1_z029R [Acanthocystis turfacea chlorella virus 1]|uniref:Uncharacterized protein z029R n=1 Tax=Chlorovirus heliozoae TaxID=322019 RepID=A7K7Y9_9PHYC|nr:hypothetical protein ATCV1_z029R [Acanthocystis turfacea chlorella virus 1]ABT16163.1 hypothetical protein ATCV1_z029R [Acanthocystis turfacea chlorella virus 1]